jgi:Tfp pilus assembly protein PilX
VLPIVLIGLLVITMFGAAIARSLVSQSKHARRLEYQQQAAWLAESGVQHASNRLANEADYEGETWRIDSDDSGLDAVAVVLIHVEQIDESDGGRLVTIEALD